jgi:peptide/nickel transport system substrate-binding protein
VRVRTALSLALDRAVICSTLLGGTAQPAGGLMAPAHWSYSGAPPLPHDAERARQGLGDAGAEGMHVALLTSTERLRGDVARVLAQELEAVGVRVEVIALEIGTMIARLNAGDFDLAILQLPEMTEPNVLRHFLHSAAIPPRGANRGRVHDVRLDALLDEGDRVMDVDARRAIYARIEALERDEMHVLPLWYEDQVSVTSDRARVFSPSAEGRWLALASIP